MRRGRRRTTRRAPQRRWPPPRRGGTEEREHGGSPSEVGCRPTTLRSRSPTRPPGGVDRAHPARAECRRWDRDVHRRRAALGAALLAALVALVAWQTGLLDAPERRTVDARFSVRGDQPAPASIVIVGYDKDGVVRMSQQLPLRGGTGLRSSTACMRWRAVGRVQHRVRRTLAGRLLAARRARRARPVLFGTDAGRRAKRRRARCSAAPRGDGIGHASATRCSSREPAARCRIPTRSTTFPRWRWRRRDDARPKSDRGRFGDGGATIDFAGGADTSAHWPRCSRARSPAGPSSPARPASSTMPRPPHDVHPTPVGTMTGRQAPGQRAAHRPRRRPVAIGDGDPPWTVGDRRARVWRSPLARWRAGGRRRGPGPGARGGGARRLPGHRTASSSPERCSQRRRAWLLAGVLAEGLTLMRSATSAPNREHRHGYASSSPRSTRRSSTRCSRAPRRSRSHRRR